MRSCSIFTGSALFRQAEAGGEPLDVGVHDDAFIDAEGVAEDDVGGLAADAGERGERLHGGGHFAAVLATRCGAAGTMFFALARKKPVDG